MSVSRSQQARERTPVRFSTELTSGPVGAVLEATVDRELPPPAQAALLADVREKLIDQQRNLLFRSIRVAHGTLRSYGQRHDYNVEPVTESVEVTSVTETRRSLTVRWVWDHESAQYFNFGVPEHTIGGDPILSFIWEDAPQEVREMFANTERVGGDPRVYFRSVDHPGIPAARFVQAGLSWLRQEVQ